MVQQSDTTARGRLLRGLPVQGRRLDVDGIATLVLEGGQGPPALLLHGGIESGGVYWAPVISRLAQSSSLVVPDVPGLGESAPIARLDPGTFADWFARLLRLTCREEPTLIVHSLLGSLAARFATTHGDLLRGVVLVGAPGIGPYRLPLGLRVAAIRSALRPTERNLEGFLPWPFLDPTRTRQRDPEWFAAFSAYMLSRGAVPSVKRTMRQLIKVGTEQIPDAELRHIDVPTTLVWGRHDRMVPVHLAEGASRRFGWPLHVIEDAGHVPFVERPDAFLDALGDAMPALKEER